MLLDQQAGPDNLIKIFASLSLEQCKRRHELAVKLIDGFQKGLVHVSAGLQTRPLEPFHEVYRFSEAVHSTLNCSAETCKLHARHKAMLKLGKYKRELTDHDSWHLYVLLSSPVSQQHWCETAMYRAKGRRYVQNLA
jgi:hypothetical protein